MVALVKIGKFFLVGFFAATAQSDFVLKKRLKDAYVLAFGEHRTARIVYK